MNKDYQSKGKNEPRIIKTKERMNKDYQNKGKN